MSAFAREILQARSLLTTRFDQLSRRLDVAIQSLLDVDLRNWEREQRLATNGLPNSLSVSATSSSSSSSSSSNPSSSSSSSQASKAQSLLNLIRTKGQKLADILWKLSLCIEATKRRNEQLPDASSGGTLSRLIAVRERNNHHVTTLISGTMIVDRQPPQVLKTQTRFQCQVRHLLGAHVAGGSGSGDGSCGGGGGGGGGGGEGRGTTLTPSSPSSTVTPTVTAHMINEAEYSKFMRGEKRVGVDAISDCGVIQNNVAKLDFNVKNRTLVATFPNMQLKSIRRAEKKGERVAEEKFVILYHCQIDLQSPLLTSSNSASSSSTSSSSSSPASPTSTAMTCHAWTVSSAMGVIVHASQECNTFGTIFWDNAFAAPRRESFATPEFVAWQDLAASLNSCFAATTGRHLSPTNIEFLRMKLLQV